MTDQGRTTPAGTAATKKPRGSKQRPLAQRDPGLPGAQGLYDPSHEKDSCGVGFIADMKNRKSHGIVQQGLQILRNLDHRGAVGADPKMGDGCGILVQIPHRFFAAECAKTGIWLPEPGQYGVGHLFMPRDPEGLAIVEGIVTKAMADEGLPVIGWRDVPVDPSDLGESVKATEPVQRQVGKVLVAKRWWTRAMALSKRGSVRSL